MEEEDRVDAHGRAFGTAVLRRWKKRVGPLIQDHSRGV